MTPSPRTHLALTLALALALPLNAIPARAQAPAAPTPAAAQPAPRPPASDPRDARLLQQWNALPRAARARIRSEPAAPGAAPMPAWLAYGTSFAPESGFCGYNERGRAVMVIALSPASRRSAAHAVEQIARTRGLEGNELVAELTREEVLRVATVPGVLAVHPDGCSHANTGSAPGVTTGVAPEQ